MIDVQSLSTTQARLGNFDITQEPETKEDEEEMVFPSLTKPKREPQVSENSGYYGVHHDRRAEVWCLVMVDDGRGRGQQEEGTTKS